MNKLVTVEQALKALGDNGFWAEERAYRQVDEFIHVTKPGEYLDITAVSAAYIRLPTLFKRGDGRRVCDPAGTPFESAEKLIQYCETTIPVETRAKTGDEF